MLIGAACREVGGPPRSRNTAISLEWQDIRTVYIDDTAIRLLTAEFTLDIYTNVTKEMQKEAAKRIGGFMADIL